MKYYVTYFRNWDQANGVEFDVHTYEHTDGVIDARFALRGECEDIKELSKILSEKLKSYTNSLKEVTTKSDLEKIVKENNSHYNEGNDIIEYICVNGKTIFKDSQGTELIKWVNIMELEDDWGTGSTD